MTKASDLRDMAVPELELALVDLNKELYTLVNEMKRTKKLEKPHLIRLKKKERARLLTILHEKQSVNL
jgi:large subunit ribosomal protein L29